MKIVSIISTHKRARGKMSANGYIPPQPISRGMKRVMAIVKFRENGQSFTRHIDVPR